MQLFLRLSYSKFLSEKNALVKGNTSLQTYLFFKLCDNCCNLAIFLQQMRKVVKAVILSPIWYVMYFVSTNTASFETIVVWFVKAMQNCNTLVRYWPLNTILFSWLQLMLVEVGRTNYSTQTNVNKESIVITWRRLWIKNFLN